MRAAIYVRISRDRVGAGLGIERQEADCRELAGQLGHTVTRVYADNDISAYSGKPRPAYLELLESIGRGTVDVVLAWHTDRLHRSPTELERYITTCEERGVPTHTVKAGALDLATPSGRLVARQLGAVARYEVEHLIERQQRAKRQVAEAGRWGGGRRPYGYDADGVTVRPREARFVVEATDAIINGASLRSEAARLTEAGATTSTGRTWTPTELRRVLVRARNAGLREHRGRLLGKAEWPPLVAEEKWRAAVSILSDPARRTSFSRARRWLLTGIASCGVCGGSLRVMLLATSHKGVPSYTCSVGKHVVRNASELEAMISRVIVERLKRPDIGNRMRVSAIDVDVAALRAEAGALRTRLDDLADDLEMDERTLTRRTRKLNERLAEVQGQLVDASRGDVVAEVAGADDVQAAWDALHLDRKRAIIAELATIVVHRTKKGRPPGWRPGSSYFNPAGIEVVGKG